MQDDTASEGDHQSTEALKEAPQNESSLITWQDVALSIGAELMYKVRTEILETLGYTTSAVSSPCLA